VVERELDGHRVVVAIDGPREVVEQRVHVRARREAATVLVEPAHLLARPRAVLVEVVRMDPVDRDVGARGHVGLRELARGWIAQCLERARRDPAPSGEEPRADEATRVEVIALVPPVVRDLVAALRVDHREEHVPDFDRKLLHRR
jgi:hypothetical protein